MNTGRTFVNASLGAIVTIVAGLVPVVSFVAPLLGGAIAGFLQREGPRGGVAVGAATGLMLTGLSVALVALAAVVPAMPAAALMGPWARGVGLVGIPGGVPALVAVSGLLLVVVGALGGALGGVVAGSGRAGPRTRQASSRL